MNKNIKEAKRKFEILLIIFIIFQIIGLFGVNSIFNKFLLEMGSDSNEFLLIKKIITPAS